MIQFGFCFSSHVTHSFIYWINIYWASITFNTLIQRPWIKIQNTKGWFVDKNERPSPIFFPPGVQKSKITSSEPHKQIYKVNYSSLWTQILNLNHFSCEISGLPSVAHNSLVHEPVTKEQNLFGNVLKLQISVLHLYPEILNQ